MPAQEGMRYAWELSGGTITSAADGPSITFDAGSGDALTLEVAVTNELGDTARGEAELRLVWGYSTAVGEMSTPRAGARAQTLADGRVLVAGGRAAHTLGSAELFSAATETFSATAPMEVERSDHSMTRLPDGRVLVVGGRRQEAEATEVHDSAEIFDPSTETWAPTASMAEARYAHTATSLEDGRVLVAGGAGADLEGIATAEIFDPESETWSPVGALREARAGHAAHRLADGQVLVVGTAWGASAAAERYDPAADAWSPAGGEAALPWLSALVGLPSGNLLLAGGVVPGEGFESTGDAWIYDGDADAFLPAPPMSEARGLVVSFLLPNGKVLLAGGVVLVPTETEPLEAGAGAVELYDPLADTFQRAEDLLEPRGRAAAALLPDGRVLIAGGVGEAEGEARASAELFTY